MTEITQCRQVNNLRSTLRTEHQKLGVDCG